LDRDSRKIGGAKEGNNSCRERNINSIIRIIKSTTSLGFRNANNRKEYISYSNSFSERIFRSEEIFDNGRPDNSDFISI
jgi:hypothetical protein